MIRIVVGSMNPLKIAAVKEAASELGLAADVLEFKAESGVPSQPFSHRQTMMGATHRALQAQESDSEAYAIGIENGLVEQRMATYDVAYVVVITPFDMLFTLSSAAVQVPDEIVHASLASSLAVTAGKLEAERSGSDPEDPHRIWSDGKTDRKTILKDVIVKVLLAATREERGTSS